jgi:membrane protein required for colicin V production
MIIDIVVGAVVLISAAISFLRGAIRELLTIAGVIGGLFAAMAFAPSLSPIFRDWLGVSDSGEPAKLFDIIPMSIVADICAYASIFIIVVIIISVISHFTSASIKAMGLGPVDRTLGVIFGIVRAVVLLALLYLPFHLLMDENAKAKYFSDSKTHTYIEKTAEFIVQFLPSNAEMKNKSSEIMQGGIRKKLFENDILYNKDAKPEAEPETEKEPEESGYKDENRSELNELFEENAENPKEEAKPSADYNE